MVCESQLRFSLLFLLISGTGILLVSGAFKSFKWEERRFYRVGPRCRFGLGSFQYLKGLATVEQCADGCMRTSGCASFAYNDVNFDRPNCLVMSEWSGAAETPNMEQCGYLIGVFKWWKSKSAPKARIAHWCAYGGGADESKNCTHVSAEDPEECSKACGRGENFSHFNFVFPPDADNGICELRKGWPGIAYDFAPIQKNAGDHYCGYLLTQ